MPHIASCACGQLTATCDGEPLRTTICHCLACKRSTGTAFSWNARFAPEQVSTDGISKTYVRVGDEGSAITHHFCPECGVMVWYLNDQMPDFIALRVGAFAEPGFMQPSVSVYHGTDRREPWLEITAMPLKIMD